MELTEELRQKYEIGNADPVYTIHTTFNEEELRRAIYTTRLRERLRYCAILLILAALCLVLAAIYKTTTGIGGAFFCVVLCLERLIKARQFTDKQIGELYERFGFAREDQTLYCFDEKLLVLNHIYECSHAYEYQSFTALYLKRDFLFLTKENNHGRFVRYADIPDRDALIAFLKVKCPDLRMRK